MAGASAGSAAAASGTGVAAASWDTPYFSEAAYVLSGSSRRSSSANSSAVSRRLSATFRSGCPGMHSVASPPSALFRTMSPSFVARRTAVRPGPDDSVRRTGTCSRSASHMASSSQLGLSPSPSTVAETTVRACWSSAAASMERHGVIRVHARSVSPGAYAPAREPSVPTGFSQEYVSVMRRCPSAPSGSPARSVGAPSGHQTTTGASGRSSGRTTDWAWSTSSP